MRLGFRMFQKKSRSYVPKKSYISTSQWGSGGDINNSYFHQHCWPSSTTISDSQRTVCTRQMASESSWTYEGLSHRKGYTTKIKFHKYGLNFVKFLKSNMLADKRNLLIVDGHKSHFYNLPFKVLY